jgi:hypothetical protein
MMMLGPPPHTPMMHHHHQCQLMPTVTTTMTTTMWMHHHHHPTGPNDDECCLSCIVCFLWFIFYYKLTFLFLFRLITILCSPKVHPLHHHSLVLCCHCGHLLTGPQWAPFLDNDTMWMPCHTVLPAPFLDNNIIWMPCHTALPAPFLVAWPPLTIHTKQQGHCFVLFFFIFSFFVHSATCHHCEHLLTGCHVISFI